MNVKVSKPVNLDNFWSVEAMGVDVGNCECKARLSAVEDMEGKLIEDSSSKVGNQWLIPYPWAKDPSQLPNNRGQAIKMLNGLEKRLKKNKEHGAAYQKQMEEMVKKGFSRKLNNTEMKLYQGPVHYLPHHAVVRAENKSTPVRIVFNSANRCQGEAINEYWMKGPDLLNNLSGVLMRFREREVAVCGDISKMYHRVLIPEMDQHVHRYLWRDLNSDRDPDTYVMQVLTFGDKPAAAMAQTALRLTAKEGEEMYPRAAHVLKNETYMDDICVSVTTIEEAKTLTKQMDAVLGNGGFNIKEWISNKPLNNEERKDKEQKVLGVSWNYADDTLKVKVKLDDDITNAVVTKRKALGMIAQVFDPIGFLAPVVVKLKIKMQELWKSGVNWDEDLPNETQQEWRILLKELNNASEIKLPRCLTPDNSTDAQLIIFCDASEKAYGACAYLRWRLQDGLFKTRFVTAKSRVAPLKKLTIPRLELQAAVMAARMGKSITDESSLPLTDVLFFTDSMIVLGWLKKPSCCYKQFVGTRVLEIQNKTKPENWRHVSGVENPADDVSRGIPVTNLNGRWIRGPPFLQSPMHEWEQENLRVEDDDSEIKLVKFTGNVEIKQVRPEVEIDNCETWEEMLEVYRRRIYGDDSPALDVYKVRDIELLLLRRVQRECFAEELQLLRNGKGVQSNSRICNLDPMLEAENEVIRVGGRLRNVEKIDLDVHPILLDPKHRITKLLIRRADANVFNHSAGPNQVFAYLRRKYWILKGRSQIKSELSKCIECQKWRKGPETPKMAELPEARLRIGKPPFFSTGMDCWGPMMVKVRRSQEKRWGLVFKCMTTKAVHLEILHNMNTDAFIMAFRRFVSRKGVPKELYSDCGTNFRGAERELHECFKAMSPALQEKLAQQQVEFKFNPPNAPHFGGVWEREVKSVKNAIKCSLKDRVVTEVVLQTVIVEVEGLMNSKPLGYASSNVSDADPVTPNVLLMGRRDPSLPFSLVSPQEIKSKKQWRHSQLIIDLFWKKFVSEYLPSQQIRQKWDKETENLKEGDQVLVVDNQAQRGDWLTGEVLKVHPSADGRVRVADVKMKEKVYKRPVVKLIKLEEWKH
ncbi:uncharacterized protein [Antedon mediterranea]|uniref:uncharacterized protein n=1 Tax=Antedon mediterranea TaxID=105859 RepID=UPI003AF83536